MAILKSQTACYEALHGWSRHSQKQINTPWNVKVWISQTDVWKCFHLRLNGTGWDGKSVVRSANSITSTARVFPRWLDMLRYTISHEESWVEELSIPLTFMKWHQRCKRRCCAELFMINKVDDAKSIRALALIEDALALTIWTRPWLTTT